MFKKIIELFSKDGSANSRVGQSDEVSQADAHSKELLQSADELKKLGDQYYNDKVFARADFYYKQSLGIDQAQHEVCKNLGVIQYYQGKFEFAVKYYDQAIELKPDYAEAYSNRGLALIDLNRFDEALINLDKAIALKPDFAFAYNNRGMALQNLKKLDDAMDSFDRAIELKPDYAEAYNNRGALLYLLNKLDEALLDYDSAIALKLNFADALNNRAVAISDIGRPEEALVILDEVVTLKPTFAAAYHSRGRVLRNLNKLQDALQSYNQAIELQPDLADAHNFKGEVLHLMMRYNEALECYERAIAIKPDFAEAHNNRGTILYLLNKLDEALLAYDLAIKHAPDHVLYSGSRLEIKMKLCDWSDYAKDLSEAEQEIRLHKRNSTHPFAAMALFESASLQKQAAEVFVHEKCPPNYTLPPIKQISRKSKIRIAYFSADFCNHAVTYLTAELFEKHDKSKFEVFAFSLVTHPNDDMRRRIEPAFDRFIDVSTCSDKEVALKARDMEIDIAIDLGGFTNFSRAGIFSLRAAPVQVNYIGYPGTMGADYIDYIVVDRTIVPNSHQKFYAEKIAYLPCFQVNDTKRAISDRIFSREELDLPETGFVFCSFSNIYKITPLVFDSWMRILKQVEGSVLWLIGENPSTIANLKKEASLREVDSGRLVFAKRVSPADYMARYRTADLFLDTLPFNAGTTASDALWAGLPVLTQIGEAFAARMAASLLSAIHLPELITNTSEGYEALAIELATNPDKLLKIKQRLADNRLTTPLFDIEYFTRNLEDAYGQMYERHHAGLPPGHIYSKDAK